MFGIGSLKYLHTFAEVSYIYKIDASTLRKKVLRGELVRGIEVEKFGGTWIITEKAMVEHFGIKQFSDYLATGVVAEFQFSVGTITSKRSYEDDEDNFMI